MSGSYPERIRVEHQVALDNLMDDFKSTSMVQLLVEESPEYALEVKEREFGAGLVVMGAISRSVLSDTIIGSTTEKIIDYLKSDVLVIKA
jgi:nucleotide-binding universal stress UspA family protein